MEHQLLIILNNILSTINNNQLSDKLIISDYLNTLNGNTLWKVFEYYSCKINNVIPWDLLPLELKEILANKNIFRDFGIDGISNDLLTSLQCKYRDNTNISFREISTFYGLSSIIGCKNLILDLLNTSKYYPLINSFPNLRINKIQKITFLNNLTDFIVCNNENIKNIRIKKELKNDVNLRYYQIEAFDIFKNRLNKLKFTNLQLCCGSGKSLIILEAIKYYITKFTKNILILVPSIQLCNDMDKLLTEFNPIIYNDLQEKKSKVYICVYNSIDKVKDIKFGLKIIDEAHHLDYKINKNTYRKTIQNIKVNHTLSLTATFHKDIEIHYDYNLEQGIKDGYINDYDVIVPFFKTPSELDEKLKSLNEEKTEYKKPAQRYSDKLKILIPYIFKSYLNLIQNRIDFTKILVYCNTIKESKEFVKFLNENDISSCHIDGDMSIKDREQILLDFETKYRVLSSINVLGEGINLTYVNTCIFVAPRYSFININQCIGRVIRKKDQLSHIVLPHIIENDLLERFINTLSINDTRLRNKDKSYSKTRIVLQQTYLDNEYNNDLDNIVEIYYEKFDNINNLIENNLDKRIDKYIKWVYKNKREPTRSSAGEEKSIYNIGSKFRTLKRQNQLSETIINKLSNVINDGYFWWEKENPLQINIRKYIQWMKHANKDIIYNIKYPSKKSNDETEQFLAKWSKEIRYISSGKRDRKLTDKEIKQFDDLGIYWYWNKDYFETNYKLALTWYERNKRKPKERRGDKSEDLDEDGKVEKKLYGWFIKLRSIKQKMKDNKLTKSESLTKEQLKKLDKLIEFKMFKWR